MTSDNNNNFKNLTITFGCFNTNIINETKSLQSMIKAFCKEAQCSDIKYQSDFQYELKHKILTEHGHEIETTINFIEINLTKKIKISNEIDCYIIFFDLENNDSLVEFEKILKCLNTINLNDKKIYLINFFMNKNNIKNVLTEEKIQAYFEKFQLFNYSISEIDLTNSYIEFKKKVLDSVSLDALQEKLFNNDEYLKNKEIYDGNNSNSKCFIF